MPETKHLPSAMATHGSARVTIQHVVLVRNDYQHAFRHPDPDVGPGYTDSIFFTPGVLAKKRGVLDQTWICRQCGSSLDQISAGSVSADVEYPVEGYPPNRLEITAPGFTCGACGVGNVRPDRATEFDISEALRNLFEEHGFIR